MSPQIKNNEWLYTGPSFTDTLFFGSKMTFHEDLIGALNEELFGLLGGSNLYSAFYSFIGLKA
jgi:hypothetical protein